MRESEEKIIMLSGPPRLLLGISFLFWGAMHDRPLAALIAAILVEGRHWTKLRWDFTEKGFARSWQLSALVLVASAIGLLQKDVLTASDFLDLLSWLPFIMLPLILAQQYAKAEGVPMVTFSFIARRKMLADRKAGRPVDQTAIHLGYPFMILIASTAGMGVGSLKSLGLAEFRYAIGVAVLVGLSLLKMRAKRVRPAAWGVAYVSSMFMAVGIAWVLFMVYDYYLKSLSQGGSRQSSSMEAQTSIGKVHQLQQSPKILWRYFHEKGEVPNLLKLGSYNEPLRNVWLARSKRTAADEKIPAGQQDFQRFLNEGENQFVYHEEDRDQQIYPVEGRIVGMVSEKSLIPHPKKTKRYEGVPADNLAANSFGAVQMEGVNQGAIDTRMFADRRLRAIELDPSDLDLTYPEKEEDRKGAKGEDKEGLSDFLKKIGLSPPEDGLHPERSLSKMVSTLRNVPVAEFRDIEARLAHRFADPEKFNYSLFLTGASLEAPISEFLHEKKKGHCEYFAGATAMLLRRMGIPSRYVVGFAVQEQAGDGEWILRGQHAHAWAQAYLGGTWVNEPGGWRCRGGEWVDVDLTPPDWLSQGNQRPWYQFFSDWFQKARAASVLWFARPSVLEGFKIVLMIVVPVFLIYLVYQLIRTRGRDELGTWDEAVGKAGLLRDFERWLARKVGPRPRSMPMGTWLRKHLPASAVGLADSYEAATYRQDGITVEELQAGVRKAKSAWKERKNPGTG